MANRNGPAARLVSGLAVLVLFATIGLTLYRSEAHARRNSTVTSGIVVRNEAGRPVIRIPDGQTVTTEQVHTAGGTPLYVQGEQVNLLYDPMRPGTARIDSIFGRWGLPLLCGIAAVLGFLFVARRPRAVETA